MDRTVYFCRNLQVSRQQKHNLASGMLTLCLWYVNTVRSHSVVFPSDMFQDPHGERKSANE